MAIISTQENFLIKIDVFAVQHLVVTSLASEASFDIRPEFLALL